MRNTKIEPPKEPEFKKLPSSNNSNKPDKRKTRLHLKIKLLRSVFLLLEHSSPQIAGWLATRLWLATHRFPEPLREQRWLKTTVISELKHQNGRIKLYQWHQKHENAPRVLLIHGWNGRGLQLAFFVKPLLLQGFQVISFDAPGHGRSPGTECNLLDIADVVHCISAEIGPIDSIISHSFGAMVMARVVRDGLCIRKAVAISSPRNTDYLIAGFCTMLKIKGQSKQNLMHRIKHRFGEDIFTRISAINNVKHLSIPGLIVHDSKDQEIPVSHAYELNQLWADSEILITNNLGHLRILRDQRTCDKIVDFIARD